MRLIDLIESMDSTFIIKPIWNKFRVSNNITNYYADCISDDIKVNLTLTTNYNPDRSESYAQLGFYVYDVNGKKSDYLSELNSEFPKRLMGSIVNALVDKIKDIKFSHLKYFIFTIKSNSKSTNKKLTGEDADSKVIEKRLKLYKRIILSFKSKIANNLVMYNEQMSNGIEVIVVCTQQAINYSKEVLSHVAKTQI